jgi:hypothetical protein
LTTTILAIARHIAANGFSFNDDKQGLKMLLKLLGGQVKDVPEELQKKYMVAVLTVLAHQHHWDTILMSAEEEGNDGWYSAEDKRDFMLEQMVEFYFFQKQLDALK